MMNTDANNPETKYEIEQRSNRKRPVLHEPQIDNRMLRSQLPPDECNDTEDSSDGEHRLYIVSQTNPRFVCPSPIQLA